MKSSFIFLISLFLISGCAQLKDLTDGENFEIISAGYSTVDNPSVQGSVTSDTRINLAVIVRRWPEEGYNPKFFVYNGQRSGPIEITMEEGNEVVMNATIDTRSAPKVDVSDRLAYIRPDGSADFLLIEEWNELAPQ